jgi:transketolase C-terminal domain/subunit
MKMLPGMTVIVPCDYAQTKAATMAIAEYQGPVYCASVVQYGPSLLKKKILKLVKLNVSAKEQMYPFLHAVI